MDASCTDLEFFDLSNATEQEVKEIKEILGCNASNGCIELPWEVPLIENHLQKTEQVGVIRETCNSPLPPVTTANTINTVVGPALLYGPPIAQTMQTAQANPLHMQSLDVLPSVEAFIPPPMTAASPMGPHYPAPFVVPRTLSLLHAYPHVGVPLFTCTLPGTGELTHVASPYTPFLPIAAPVSAVPQTHLEKPSEHEERPKFKGFDDRQFSRRSKRKHSSSGSYYSPGSDTYDTVLTDDPTNVGSNRLAAVPCVPVPMPQSTFPVTSGALPMPGYPPGLHPLSYSHISGPQHPTTPVYYVPLFNHPSYSRYIPSAAAPMMLPVSGVHMQPAPVRQTSESECSTFNEVPDDLKSSESLAASTESIGKTSESSAPLESDSDGKPCNELRHCETHEDESKDARDSCSSKSRETCRLRSPKEQHLGGTNHESYNDGSKCWADLFKKQCNMNGVDTRQTESSNPTDLKVPKLDKDLTNGKMFDVPM